MLTTVAVATLSAVVLVQDTDTTLAVDRDARLHVENHRGEVVIETWDREQVRIVAEHDDRERVSIDRVGSLLRVRSRARRGPPGSVEFRITVPRWMPLEVNGPFTDVSVDGVRGDITVETVQGDIDVRGGERLVSLRSVEGDIEVTDARGAIEAGAVNGDVRIDRSSGAVSANTVNGEVYLLSLTSTDIAATTVNGDVVYDGTVDDNGRYRLTTHNGDIAMSLPESANATVSVATFNGELEASFPLALTDFRSGRKFSFVLGAGSATVELQTFQGTIQLRRPGEIARTER